MRLRLLGYLSNRGTREGGQNICDNAWQARENLLTSRGKLPTDSGVRIINGRAVIVDPHTVAIGNERLTSQYILIATGGWPTIPEIPGAELAISSNEAFVLERFPSRAIIVGGGYIGVEFAGIFHGLGAKVTLVHRGPLFLRGFDDDLRQTLADRPVRAPTHASSGLSPSQT